MGMRVFFFPGIAVAALIVTVPGCGRNQPSSAKAKSGSGSGSAEQAARSPEGTPAPQTAAADSPAVFATQPRPANAPVTPIVLSDPGNLEKTLADLTQALRKYSFENRRMPKSFSEVVTAGYIQPVPQPPPNKKFEIDPKTKRVVVMTQ